MEPCIFCRIIKGKIPGSLVFKDKICTAFMDIKPINEGHLLIAPNKHFIYLSDLDPKIGAHLFKIAQKLSQAIRKSSLKCEGINLFLADGEVAGQEIFHLHLHVIPRFRGDGFGLRFGPNYGKILEKSELDKVANQIKSHIK